MNPVQQFEAEFKQYVGSDYAIAVNSGTSALHTALLSVGVKYGDAVITTPYTFPATANAILYCGAYPVFVDILEDGTLNPDAVEAACKLTLEATTILPVHIFGRPCHMEELLLIADKYGLRVVEDASQAVGGRYLGKALGTFGDAGTYSFYASKNLPTGGGMVVTNRQDVALRAECIRNHGFDDDGNMVMMGFNYNMNWKLAFDGQQYLYLHKPAIEAELGRFSETDGYYPKLVYQHSWYQDNKDMWVNFGCPVAEAKAKGVSQQ